MLVSPIRRTNECARTLACTCVSTCLSPAVGDNSRGKQAWFHRSETMRLVSASTFDKRGEATRRKFHKIIKKKFLCITASDMRQHGMNIGLKKFTHVIPFLLFRHLQYLGSTHRVFIICVLLSCTHFLSSLVHVVYITYSLRIIFFIIPNIGLHLKFEPVFFH